MKLGDHRREIVHLAHADEGKVEAEGDVSAVPYGGENGSLCLFRRAHEANKDVSLSFVRDDVRRAATFDQADVEGRWADLRLGRQWHRQHVVECLNQLVDGGVAKLGISGVGHAALGAKFDAQVHPSRQARGDCLWVRR